VNPHHISAGTKNFTVNLPQDLYSEIKALAEQSGVKMGNYVRLILKEAAEKNIKLTPTASGKMLVIMQGEKPRDDLRLNEKPARSSAGDRGAIEPGITGGPAIYKSKVAKA
jgi:hypothetical protein